MGTSRKPAGFWKKDTGHEVVAKYVRGEVGLDEAVELIRDACREAGVDEAYLTDPILEEDVKWYARGARKELGLPRMKEAARSGSVRPVERVAIGEGGRVVIPAPYRQALNLNEGDEVILQLAAGELRLLTPREALRRAQELISRYVPAGRSLAEELIEERRQEARRERSGG